jgi:hypothetical protein
MQDDTGGNAGVNILATVGMRALTTAHTCSPRRPLLCSASMRVTSDRLLVDALCFFVRAVARPQQAARAWLAHRASGSTLEVITASLENHVLPALTINVADYPQRELSDGTLISALAQLGYEGLATANGFEGCFPLRK